MTQATRSQALPPKDVWSTTTYVVYQVFAHLVAPVMLAAFLLRSRREPLYRARFQTRLGLGWTASPRTIWIFAASLGETRAAAPLVEELIHRGYKVALTHSSAAGLAEGQRLAATMPSGTLQVGYAPLDLFWCVRLFLSRLQPTAGLVLESEIWPAQLIEARAKEIPMLQVNGNLHERSLRHLSHRLGRIRLGLYQSFSAICTKSKQHLERYHTVGANLERIHLVGELKFDRKPNAQLVQNAQKVRQNWCADTPTFLIASSVEDEEHDLCALVLGLCKALPDLRVVWVPRSPQRFQSVAKMTTNLGLNTAKRSEVLDAGFTGAVASGITVLIGDSIGEMDAYYALADLVFVGATLANHGGHNIIEPLSLGKPVVVGPSLYGITFPAYDALAENALSSYPDVRTLTDAVVKALSDSAALEALQAGCAGFVERHKGASGRTVDVLEQFL